MLILQNHETKQRPEAYQYVRRFVDSQWAFSGLCSPSLIIFEVGLDLQSISGSPRHLDSELGRGPVWVSNRIQPQWLDTLEIGLQVPWHSKDVQSGASLLASISQYSRGFEAEFTN